MKIKVRVYANSKMVEVGKDGDGYIVRVKEPAKEGKANLAVVKALAGYFKVPRASIKIVSGQRGKNKVVEISTP